MLINKQSRNWRKIKVAGLLLATSLGVTSLVAPQAQADDSLLWHCDFAQHLCLNHVRLDDGSVVAYKWSWDNNGNYWLVGSGMVSQ
jgi:hypothetical protein